MLRVQASKYVSGEVLERYNEVREGVAEELVFSIAKEMHKNNIIEIQEYDSDEYNGYLLDTKEFVAECFVMSRNEKKEVFNLLQAIKGKLQGSLKSDFDRLHSILSS